METWQADPEGRFEGQRKVELDMPRTDTTFIRQRLALHVAGGLDQPVLVVRSQVGIVGRIVEAYEGPNA